MNILADESVDGPIVERLRQEGYAVIYVAELTPGISDEEVLQQANADAALLITADKDFGELVFRNGLIHAGVVLMRLAGLQPSAKAERVIKVFSDRMPQLQNAFTVVSRASVRIRKRI